MVHCEFFHQNLVSTLQSGRRILHIPTLPLEQGKQGLTYFPREKNLAEIA
jgi:hypothetical protein